jgi:hypothetical protein
MPVVTLIASSDNPGEREELKAWIRSNGPTLTFVSDNEGCGCCVDIYRVEGPQETIGQAPKHLVAVSYPERKHQ